MTSSNGNIFRVTGHLCGEFTGLRWIPHTKASDADLWCFLIIRYCPCANEHDDVIKWKHFPRYWPFVRGIHRSPVNSPHKGQWRGSLMFSLICAWINRWVNNGEAGDLRRYRTHYDVIVMVYHGRQTSVPVDDAGDVEGNTHIGDVTGMWGNPATGATISNPGLCGTGRRRWRGTWLLFTSKWICLAVLIVESLGIW